MPSRFNVNRYAVGRPRRDDDQAARRQLQDAMLLDAISRAYEEPINQPVDPLIERMMQDDGARRAQAMDILASKQADDRRYAQAMDEQAARFQHERTMAQETADRQAPLVAAQIEAAKDASEVSKAEKRQSLRERNRAIMNAERGTPEEVENRKFAKQFVGRQMEADIANYGEVQPGTLALARASGVNLPAAPTDQGDSPSAPLSGRTREAMAARAEAAGDPTSAAAIRAARNMEEYEENPFVLQTKRTAAANEAASIEAARKAKEAKLEEAGKELNVDQPDLIDRYIFRKKPKPWYEPSDIRPGGGTYTYDKSVKPGSADRALERAKAYLDAHPELRPLGITAEDIAKAYRAID